MTVLEQLTAGSRALGAVVIATIVVYAWVVLLTRLSGPRSLAKMSSYDFAATVAVGSTAATTALNSVPLVAGLVVLVLLFGLQATIGTLRRRGSLGGVLDNRPLLLLADGQVRPEAMAQARIGVQELHAQLRQSGITDPSQVAAVVLETTGDMSVLRDGPVAPSLLEGVRGA